MNKKLMNKIEKLRKDALDVFDELYDQLNEEDPIVDRADSVIVELDDLIFDIEKYMKFLKDKK